MNVLEHRDILRKATKIAKMCSNVCFMAMFSNMKTVYIVTRLTQTVRFGKLHHLDHWVFKPFLSLRIITKINYTHWISFYSLKIQWMFLFEHKHRPHTTRLNLIHFFNWLLVQTQVKTQLSFVYRKRKSGNISFGRCFLWFLVLFRYNRWMNARFVQGWWLQEPEQLTVVDCI